MKTTHKTAHPLQLELLAAADAHPERETFERLCANGVQPDRADCMLAASSQPRLLLRIGAAAHWHVKNTPGRLRELAELVRKCPGFNGKRTPRPAMRSGAAGTMYTHTAHGFKLCIPAHMARGSGTGQVTIGRVVLKLDHKSRTITGAVPASWLVDLNAPDAESRAVEASAPAPVPTCHPAPADAPAAAPAPIAAPSEAQSVPRVAHAEPVRERPAGCWPVPAPAAPAPVDSGGTGSPEQPAAPAAPSYAFPEASPPPTHSEPIPAGDAAAIATFGAEEWREWIRVPAQVERVPVIAWPDFARSYHRARADAARRPAPLLRIPNGDPRIRIPARFAPVYLLQA